MQEELDEMRVELTDNKKELATLVKDKKELERKIKRQKSEIEGLNATVTSKKQKLTNLKKAKGKKDSEAAGQSNLEQLMAVSQVAHDQPMEIVHALVGGRRRRMIVM